MEDIKEETEEKSVQANERLGLVMEGGAMRGLFTCGVIDVFMEQGMNLTEPWARAPEPPLAATSNPVR